MYEFAIEEPELDATIHATFPVSRLGCSPGQICPLPQRRPLFSFRMTHLANAEGGSTVFADKGHDNLLHTPPRVNETLAKLQSDVRSKCV